MQREVCQDSQGHLPCGPRSLAVDAAQREYSARVIKSNRGAASLLTGPYSLTSDVFDQFHAATFCMLWQDATVDVCVPSVSEHLGGCKEHVGCQFVAQTHRMKPWVAPCQGVQGMQVVLRHPHSGIFEISSACFHCPSTPSSAEFCLMQLAPMVRCSKDRCSVL